MERKIVVLALTMISICMPAKSADVTAQNETGITMKQYTDGLLEAFGPNAIVDTAKVDGSVDGDRDTTFTDIWPLPEGTTQENREQKSITIRGTPTNIICGSFPFFEYPEGLKWIKWCKTPVVANHEAKKETWGISLGGLVRQRIADYDCENTGDKNEMMNHPPVWTVACFGH